jgi:soluble lytic murein transglycosylase-like protein
MGITDALELQEGSIKELAMLPQEILMQMAQTGRIAPTLLPVVLSEKADMAKQAANAQLLAKSAQGKPPSIIEQNMAINAQAEGAEETIPDTGIAALPVSDKVFRAAGGGIVAFDDGGEVPGYSSRGFVNSNYYGIDPDFADFIQSKETGGMRNPDMAVSPKGARGRMQIMPKTAMAPGFGVKNIFDMADDMGIRYEDRSQGSAEKLLTNPQLNRIFGESYLGAMSERFGGDPIKVAAAYNAGPGAVEKAGGVPNFPETKRYVAGISPERFESASGKVRAARRDQMGLDKPRGPVEPGLGSTFDPYLESTQSMTPPPPLPGEENLQLFSDMLAGRKPIPKRSEDPSLMAGRTPPALAGKQKPTEAPAIAKTPEDDYLAELRKSLGERETALKGQKETDKYMSLLAAGLGMMGGTSPYALSNIGAGGLKGAEYYAGARKQQREEEQDILAGRLGLAKTGATEKYYQQALKDKAAGRDIQARGLQLRLADLKRKAVADWDNSPAKTELIKSFNKKDWQNDARLKGKYELEKSRFISQFVDSGVSDNVMSASSLLED